MEYCIPTDLHPRLPPLELTTDKLPPKYIGIYIEQLKQGGFRIPFSTCFSVGVDGPCRHPELSYTIKDPDGNVLTMGDFLKLPVWNKTVISKGVQFLMISVLLFAPPLHWNRNQREKGSTKSAAPRKKRVRRNQEPAGSGSERTISVTPLRQAASRPVDGTTTSIPKNTTRNVATRPYMVNIEKDVVVVKTLAFLLLRSPSFSLQPMPSMMTPRRTWACKELISHLATPIEEEFLGGLS
ncbi:hypothetical protein Tco_1223470, partial [Tanacetum coccineum]